MRASAKPDADDWPNDHDWTCDCDECQQAWAELEDEDACNNPPDGIDDEAERELDTIHGLDGW